MVVFSQLIWLARSNLILNFMILSIFFIIINIATLFSLFSLLQAPDRFKVAALRNPVCNLSLMVGTSDIPDWCYVEAFGISGQNFYTELPSAEHLNYFLTKSPIFHLSKVCVFYYLHLFLAFLFYQKVCFVTYSKLLHRFC